MITNPIRLFHITPIDNLNRICQEGGLICKNKCASKNINYHNIAHSGAQSSRARTIVPDPPGGAVHDFVPFYFAPRSPMLFAINGGRVIGCDYGQEDIFHFETTVELISTEDVEIVFYDRNATLIYSKSYTDINELQSKVAWDLITEDPKLDGYCKYFQDVPSNSKYVDRREKRMAEFLVKQRVELSYMTRIGVINEQKTKIVRAVLQQNGVKLKVEVIHDWYFPG